MEDAGPPAAATATATGGDWRSQINPLVRQVMIDNIFKTLRWHLPLSDEEGRSRLRKIAMGFECKFHTEATSKDSYKRKIAMLLIYVENMNQHSHHQEMDWSFMGPKFSRPEDAAEEVHEIRGTGISFSSKPDDLDKKAAKALREINKYPIGWLEVLADTFGMEQQDLPSRKGFFLSDGNSYWNNAPTQLKKQSGIWRLYDSCFGYGIEHHTSGIKRTFVCHKDNHKTNWFMNIYILVNENSYIQINDVVLCHVFQSDNYNPDDKYNPFPKSVPTIFDFRKKEVDSRMQQLEGLMKNPESFKDFYEPDEIYSECQANGRNKKRAGAWEHFTPIKVLGLDGEVLLTLAICHGCNMAYQTGKWDSKKGSFSHNGTKTLNEHYRKCSAQHHIAGSPQEAIHQML